MGVYVDHMRLRFGRMRMSHMIADTTAELVAMAETIGVDARHIQHVGTHREHFDVCDSKRREAIAAGAQPITTRELGLKLRARRPLLVFTNDTDYVVAYTQADAWRVWCETLGENRTDHEHYMVWRQLPRDHVLGIWWTDDGQIGELGEGTIEKRTAADWAALGRGWLCSSEA